MLIYPDINRYISDQSRYIQINSDILNYLISYLSDLSTSISGQSILIQRFPPSIGSTALASPTKPRGGDWSTSTWWIGGSVRMTAGAGSAFFVFFGVVGWVIFMGFHIGEYGIRVDTCGITIIYINMLYIYTVYIYI